MIKTKLFKNLAHGYGSTTRILSLSKCATGSRWLVAIVLTLLLSTCGDTSTTDLLNGEFVNKLADTSPPTIITPLSGATTGLSVPLQWTSKDGASNYTVEVATDANFNNLISGSPFQVEAPLTSYVLTLGTGGTYYWRVRADTTETGLYGISHIEALSGTIYVYCPATTTTCNDAGAIGHPSKPFQTISGAMNEASRLGYKNIKVATRGSETSYAETIKLKDGITLSGAYNADFKSQDMINNKTSIASSNPYAILGEYIYTPTVIEGFSIEQTGLNLTTSTAIKLNECYGNLTVSNNAIHAGSANTFSAGIHLTNSRVIIINNHITGGIGSPENAFGIHNSDNSIITELSGNTIEAGSGKITYGVSQISSTGTVSGSGTGTIESMTNNTIHGGSGEFNSYAVYGGYITIITGNNIHGGNSISGQTTGIQSPQVELISDNNIYGGDPVSEFKSSYGISQGIYTDIVNNTIEGGSGYIPVGLYNNWGTIGNISNNTIIGRGAPKTGGASSYGILQKGTLSSISNNIIYGGYSESTSSGIYILNEVTSITGNTIYSGTASKNLGKAYGIYNAAGVDFIINNTIIAQKATTTMGIYEAGGAIVIANNTISGGSATGSAWGIYLKSPPANIINNIIYAAGVNNTRYGIYEELSASNPDYVNNNNIFDQGSGGVFYFYADNPGSLSTGTTCIDAAGSTDNTRNCYSTVADVNNCAFITGCSGTTGAQGNISIGDTGSQLFINAPVMFDAAMDGPDANTTWEGSTASIEVIACDGANARYTVNEYIEIDNDGIARQITAIDCTAATSNITFSPALSVVPLAGTEIALWGNKANINIDYHLTSPTASNCNVLFGGFDYSAQFTNDLDQIIRTANVAGLPCSLTAPSDTLGAGWSIGSYEKD
ncbi:MAG: hypothetical protein OEZ13_03640 [Spirochaetia bacterium]|nr:hypothetical protein [Spirochaetia bacterium]